MVYLNCSSLFINYFSQMVFLKIGYKMRYDVVRSSVRKSAIFLGFPFKKRSEMVCKNILFDTTQELLYRSARGSV